MKITKFGHCCLLINVDGVKILTDPGSFTTEQNDISGLDAVLITHEHADHYHVDSVKAILKNNPGITMVTNSAVAAILTKEGIESIIVGDAETADIRGVKIEGFGKEHGKVYGKTPDVENTGYFIAEKFFFPGDNFYNPGKPIDILALPVAGPWMKMSEAIDYAKETKPRIAFPVHDGILIAGFRPYAAKMIEPILSPSGVEFVAMGDGETREF